MPYMHITSGTTTLVRNHRVYSALIQVNTALTGTITVSDSNTTASTTPVVAVITNPTVGNQYRYWGLDSGLVVTPSTTCDITVNYQSNYQPF